MGSNYNVYAWDQYHGVLDSEKLGYVDGLAFVLNYTDQSCDRAYSKNSEYTHGFDLAACSKGLEDLVENNEEFVKNLYRELYDSLEVEYRALRKKR